MTITVNIVRALKLPIYHDGTQWKRADLVAPAREAGAAPD